MTSAKLITGILTGIIIGVLIAPDKGTETRKKLSKSVNDLSDFVQETIDNARDKINEIADAGIDEVEKMDGNISAFSSTI